MANTASYRIFALDSTFLLSIPALLASIHFLAPATLQQALVFDHARFNGYTLLTAAYVHASNTHLYSNLVGYALTAIYTYMLCFDVDERDWFRRTLPAHLLILPIFVNLTSYAIFTVHYPAAGPVSRGFSGIVGGLGGFLLVSLYVFVKKRHDGELAYAVGLSIFLLLMQLIDLRYAGGLRPSVTGLIVLGSGLVFAQYARNGVKVPEGKDRRHAVITASAVGLVGIVLGVLILGLFPEAEALVEAETFTNVFAHATGFTLGLLLSLYSWNGPSRTINNILNPFYDFFLLIAISVMVTIGFGLIILIFYITTGIRLPGLPKLTLKAPVIGLIIVATGYSLSGFYQNSIEDDGVSESIGKWIAVKLYHVAYRSSDEIPSGNINERDVFIDFAVNVPAILFLIPIFYGTLAIYFGLIVPLQPLALIFLAIGVLAGAWADGVGRIRTQQGREYELKQEVKEAVTSQVEAFFLFIGSVLQFLVFLQIPLSETTSVAVWFFILLLLALVSYFVWSRFVMQSWEES